MTEKKQFEAVILTEESDYELTNHFAETFEGLDVTVGPKSSRVNDVIGTVDECSRVEDEGIVATITVYDEKTINKIEGDELSFCPMIAESIEDDGFVEGMDVFTTAFPSEEVGSVKNLD